MDQFKFMDQSNSITDSVLSLLSNQNFETVIEETVSEETVSDIVSDDTVSESFDRRWS